MVVTEFQPLNPCMFQDGVFAIEPEATLARLELTDDTLCVVMQSSSSRHP